MAIDWEKYDKKVDLEGLKKDVEEAPNQSGSYKEVPKGSYEVAITKLELTQSKKGDPMVAIWFKILNGEYKGSLIFMNQVVNQGFQIHIVDEFLKSLDTGVEVLFESYAQYADMLLDVFEKVKDKLEFALEYGETSKGFPTFEIKEVFEVE